MTSLLIMLLSTLAYGETQPLSFLGKPLPSPQLSDKVRAKLEADLEAAKTTFEDQRTVDNGIWYGRRMAYLGRYQEAIDIYSQIIGEFGDDPRLYRHRGHRYISLRQTRKAIADFEKAVTLIKGKKDEIEPDGMPNAQNKPRSTLHGNIYYHLALAWFLEGNLEKAEHYQKQCLLTSTNDDMLCATTHWLYMTLRMRGKDDAAAAILKPISADMDIIENGDYHQLLLMYKGERTPEQLLGQDGDGIGKASLGFGIANWYAYNGHKDKAQALFKEIIREAAPYAFGYLAGEAALAGRF